MASSISSERAFSSAGITISKRCNRLKGDIVEALQILKCLFHHDLIFQEVLHSSAIEKELDGEEIVDVNIDSGEAFGQGLNESCSRGMNSLPMMGRMMRCLLIRLLCIIFIVYLFFLSWATA